MKILITGGTNGMGKGVAQVLAGQSDPAHEIIILCRSEQLGEETIREITKDHGSYKHSIVLCDLTKLSDVKQAIAEIHEKHTYLDGVFVNAGLGYAAERTVTEDGCEAHFQVNYLSHFMLCLNLLSLLEKSEQGGRIIFNVTKTKQDHICWDDLQMTDNWAFEKGIHQAMVAKRLFLQKLNYLYRRRGDLSLSFIGFQISKTVWSNQLNIIPAYMRIMATLMKFLGTFISIEECGKIMMPLFVESADDSLQKSGKLMTWREDRFREMEEDATVLDKELQDRLWQTSLELCSDARTIQIAEHLERQSQGA
ncbi:SDR family NAD(P)-dependent oxidoreductase [Pontibacter sp. G13]|uniref:SDR family NAD(P)-dependent oxidoreductase n=1 Tax=Pontibacter sp. G13 TaxID=3074898 RepID=UPI00288ADCCA|nr:SDR family NAD(P)-dependent oxidoreductase [Pontibacter sp. G13]WNJ20350.1 SDR family NAD(P)-dependent oxidoreductase [Pontibacter sp. G13]